MKLVMIMIQFVIEKSITIPGSEIENGKQLLFCSTRTPLFKRFDMKRRRKS